MSNAGERFVDALASKDAGALLAVLRPDVDFRGMTPNRFWEATDSGKCVDEILLGAWFEPSENIVKVVEVDTGRVGSRERISYQFLVENPDGQFLVEQQAYFEADDDRIRWLRIICAGYQPID